MEIQRPGAKAATPEELKDLAKLKVLIERAVSDGKLSATELEMIRSAIRADNKVTVEELNLVSELIYEKIRQGELVYEWS